MKKLLIVACILFSVSSCTKLGTENDNGKRKIEILKDENGGGGTSGGGGPPPSSTPSNGG